MSEFNPNQGEQSDDQLNEVDLERLEELNEKAPSDLSDKEITSKITLSVKRKFDYPTWLLVFEFQNRHGKRADCLALNTTPSRNFKLVGFEFKASRSDWLQEKRDHEKNDYFVQLCDEWYVVAGKKNIVKESELPQGWGLLELKPKGSLWNLVESDLNEMQNTSLDRRFYAKFMKKALEQEFRHSTLQEAQKRGYEKAKEKITAQKADYETEKLRDKAESWDKLRDSDLTLPYRSITEDKIERLELAQWFVKQIESNEYGTLQSKLERLEKDAERHLGEIEEKAQDMMEQATAISESLEQEQ